MQTKPDIQDRSDITKLVNAFYAKVFFDPEIKHFFTSTVQINWEKHLPIMYDFWETTLFGNQKYSGNAMTPHFGVNKKSRMKPEHFKKWLELWEESVNELFHGVNAKEAINRARNIAALMEHKMNESS